MSKNNMGISLIDKPHYGYWQALYMSFYSPALYRDVCKRWKGFGALYLLLTIAILSLPLSLRVAVFVNHYIEQNVITAFKNMPLIYIQDGQVSIDKPMPYIIKNKSGNVVAIIDTTGKYKKMTDAHPFQAVLITKDAIQFRMPEMGTFMGLPIKVPTDNNMIYNLNKLDNQVVDYHKITQNPAFSFLHYLISILIYMILVSFLYSIYLVLLFVLPMMGQIIIQVFFRFKLSYKEACRVFSVSLTPHIVCLMMLTASGLFFPGVGLVYIVLFIGYFLFGAVCIKRTRHHVVRT